MITVLSIPKHIWPNDRNLSTPRYDLARGTVPAVGFSSIKARRNVLAAERRKQKVCLSHNPLPVCQEHLPWSWRRSSKLGWEALPPVVGSIPRCL